MSVHEPEADGLEEPISAEIDPRFIINLRGKSYLTYGGVLDAVTRAGVKSLVTTVVQIPTPENGQLAVVMARLEMEDGRVFTDVGDCSPASTTPQLAAAALRFASTRAKGRVCRDAVNCGAELLEEADASPGSAQPSPHPAGNGRAAVRTSRQPAPAAGAAAALCSACDRPLTKNQQTMSQHKLKMNLCPEHLAELLAEQQKAQAGG